MPDIRMFIQKRTYPTFVTVLSVKLQGKFHHLAIRIICRHVFPEAHLTVLLLTGGHTSFRHELHQQNTPGMFSGLHHEDAPGKITALQGVLSEESQRLYLGNIGIQKNKRNVLFLQPAAKCLGHIEILWDNDHPVRLFIPNALGGSGKRTTFKLVIILRNQRKVEIAPIKNTLLQTFFHAGPISIPVVVG